MSNDERGHDAEDQHIREAADWLVDLQDPDVSPERLLAWSEWHRSAPNREAFDALEPFWRLLQASLNDAEPGSDRSAQLATFAGLKSRKVSNERIRIVSEEAAHWYFLCVDEIKSLRADRAAFLNWARRSPENIAELFKIAQLEGKLHRLNLVMRSVGLGTSNVIELPTYSSPHRPRREIDKVPAKPTRRFKVAALAASLLFGTSLIFVAQQMQPAVIATGPGQGRHLDLPDGTAMYIDARSRVEVAYTEEERIVHVYEGGALFDVAKDPGRPFIARTQLIDATAVGTRFSVAINPGVTTMVSEGIVRITSRGRSDGKTVMLKAGEELSVSDTLLASPEIEHVDAERKLQWSNGLLILSGMTVAEGVEQLNRRNDMQIVVETPALGARTIEFASVKIDSPEKYAKIVAAKPGVRMVKDDEKDVIRLSLE